MVFPLRRGHRNGGRGGSAQEARPSGTSPRPATGDTQV